MEELADFLQRRQWRHCCQRLAFTPACSAEKRKDHETIFPTRAFGHDSAGEFRKAPLQGFFDLAVKILVIERSANRRGDDQISAGLCRLGKVDRRGRMRVGQNEVNLWSDAR